MTKCILFVGILVLAWSCRKKSDSPGPVPPQPLKLATWSISGKTTTGASMFDIPVEPVISLKFDAPVDRATVPLGITLKQNGQPVNMNITYQSSDSLLVLEPVSDLDHLSFYVLRIAAPLKSAKGGSLASSREVSFLTSIDSSRKFAAISDEDLLTLVQRQTFKYFWDFGHPVSGMARERNTSGETVTTGGTGFGIMSIPVAINRNFITRAEGLARMQKIVGFLRNTAPKFHGAFSHWMNGTTGAVVPFGPNDDGADIVETSFLVMGLLTARQYFNTADPAETSLRNDIDSLWRGVEWDWFRQNGKKVLYWNWSPNSGFAVNVPVQGWNECLITYVLAASSPTHPIPKPVYDSGYTRNGAMVNNNTYYGYQLPLGPQLGGPLFFSHYSFLGIKPVGLADAYASYQQQTVNHSRINYEYCKANPRNYFGYSDSVWGLTASDIQNGYTASSPTNDVSVIAPTAAISSMPYTPAESMKALRFFYYVLGDKLWGEYGFKDAFSLHTAWFADSYLAIDQGPIIVMIENHRTGLPWDLFTSCQEVKSGLLTLGFSAPYL